MITYSRVTTPSLDLDIRDEGGCFLYERAIPGVKILSCSAPEMLGNLEVHERLTVLMEQTDRHSSVNLRFGIALRTSSSSWWTWR